MTKPANVLFITADQWRADCLSALGHPCLKTPNLDRLVERGTLFTAHYTQATPCAPGRASLYTGLYQHNHRCVVNGTPLDARHSNVAMEARKAGYDPVLLGYTDATPDPRLHHPGDPALRSYEGILPGMTPLVHLDGEQRPWIAYLRALGYDVPIDGDEVFLPKPDFPGAEERGSTFAPAVYKAEHSNAAFLTDEALRYMSVRGDTPWFMHISYLAPHPPFIVPEPYHTLYDPDEVPPPRRAPSPAEEGAQHPWLDWYIYNQICTPPTIGQNPRDMVKLSDAHLRQVRATYYAMQSEIDHHFGRLVARLEELDQLDTTMIVFTTDHGEQLGDHWLFAKYGYFEQSFHIPLIVCDPRREAKAGRGRHVEAFTEAVDIMPTILDWLGLEVPAQCDGRSLLPFCHGESPGGWRREAHWQFDFRDRLEELRAAGFDLGREDCVLNVLRGERYKYVHFAALPPLLFDLQEDPDEMRDLAGDPGHRDILLDCAQKMLSWRMTHEEKVLTHHLVTSKGLRAIA